MTVLAISGTPRLGTAVVRSQRCITASAAVFPARDDDCIAIDLDMFVIAT